MQFISLSTAVISTLALDENSKLIFPLPLNKSRIFLFSNTYLFSKILNRLSFARSEVGLIGRFVGACIFLPL